MTRTSALHHELRWEALWEAAAAARCAASALAAFGGTKRRMPRAVAVALTSVRVGAGCHEGRGRGVG